MNDQQEHQPRPKGALAFIWMNAYVRLWLKG
jgi:hypothetical protein